jgi:hypothetical protein
VAQARAKELAEHEESLEAWKQRFKAEALRQISEREAALADWQSKLESKRADLDSLQHSTEVRNSHTRLSLLSIHCFPHSLAA